MEIPDPKQFSSMKILYVYDPDRTSKRDKQVRQEIITEVLSSMPKLAVRLYNDTVLPEGFTYQPMLELRKDFDPNMPNAEKTIQNCLEKKDKFNTFQGLKIFTDAYFYKKIEEDGKTINAEISESDRKQISVYFDTRNSSNYGKLFSNNQLLDSLLKLNLHWLTVCTGKQLCDLYIEDSSIIFFEDYHDYNNHLVGMRKIYDSEIVFGNEEDKTDTARIASRKEVIEHGGRPITDHFSHLDVLSHQPKTQLGIIFIDKMTNSNKDCRWIYKEL